MTYGVNSGLIHANPLRFQEAKKEEYGDTIAR